jgi:hypothetical protein
LRSGSLIGVYWALIGLGALVILAFAAVAGGLAAVLIAGMHVRGPVSFGQVPIWGMAAYAVSYLLLGVGLGVLARIYTLQRVWQRVVRACTIINIEDAADVAAAGELVSGFGEGLADGLDFGL